jgi:alpha-L-fucosidase 2
VQPTRRHFLQTSVLASLALPVKSSCQAQHSEVSDEPLDAFAIAHRHTIVRDLPTPDFFEGMLLGNGDVGVCVVVRPDALGLHIGKNDCWDIRLSDESEEYVLPFPEFLKLWQRASEQAKRQGKPDMLFLEQNVDFFRDYTKKTEKSYSRTWPRPWPCGTVWLHWDPRWVQPRIHTLDPSRGLFTLELKCLSSSGNGRDTKLKCFVDWSTGLISASTDAPVSIASVSYDPQIDQEHLGGSNPSKSISSALPAPELDTTLARDSAEFSCFQYFPAIGPTEKNPSPPHSNKDRNFALHARLAGVWSRISSGLKNRISLKPEKEQVLRLDAKLATPRDILLEHVEQLAPKPGPNSSILIPQDYVFSDKELSTPAYARAAIQRASSLTVDELREKSDDRWREFWSRSAVQLQDKELERMWYHNQYFLACCLRPGKTAPGLFGNWSSGELGTSWHGDYHLDYNCQQVFWGVFSSNHPEQHLPYLELCQNLLQICEHFTKEKFGLPGACFPLTAVPVPSQCVFIASPPYAYQVSNTPWTVQSLWWHYLYTLDRDYLNLVYPILRSAARFLAAYAKKGEDGKYHLIPTASPENWGCTVDFRLNQDCILDLALTEFLFKAVIEASSVLGTDQQELAQWKEILARLAPYPTAKGAYGEVWIDVRDAPLEAVYNVPVTLGPVFPGEQVGIGSNPEQLDLARRTALTVRLEGGNDLVFQPLIRARLAVLDLDWFKREVRYCTLPNGVANDRVRQIGGRYEDSTDFDFMMRMGFWTENFSIPAVLNECMMQSYTGTIYLFPNSSNLGPARFENLRAAGAFLISAAFDGKGVTRVSLFSEKGSTARLVSPWHSKGFKVNRLSNGQDVPVHVENEIFIFDTRPNEAYRIEPES